MPANIIDGQRLEPSAAHEGRASIENEPRCRKQEPQFQPNFVDEQVFLRVLCLPSIVHQEGRMRGASAPRGRGGNDSASVAVLGAAREPIGDRRQHNPVVSVFSNRPLIGARAV